VAPTLCAPSCIIILCVPCHLVCPHTHYNTLCALSPCVPLPQAHRLCTSSGARRQPCCCSIVWLCTMHRRMERAPFPHPRCKCADPCVGARHPLACMFIKSLTHAPCAVWSTSVCLGQPIWPGTPESRAMPKAPHRPARDKRGTARLHPLL